MVSLLEIRPLGPLKYSMHKCWKVLTEMKIKSLVQITKNVKGENKNRLSPLRNLISCLRSISNLN